MHKINPEDFYTLTDLPRLIPFITSYSKAKRIFELDRNGPNLLKGIVTGIKDGTKYSIKGENIIKFRKAIESGEVRI